MFCPFKRNCHLTIIGDLLVTMAPYAEKTTKFTLKTAIFDIFVPPFYGDNKVTLRKPTKNS